MGERPAPAVTNKGAIRNVRTVMTSSSGPDELELVDRWWRAANYLSVGQIYLRSNPLLREPL